MSDKTRGSCLKLKESRFRLDIMEKFFTLRVVSHWHRFSREGCGLPILGGGGSRLNRALSNLV